jgi:hypothetical protein
MATSHYIGGSVDSVEQQQAQRAQVLPLDAVITMPDGRTFTECFRTHAPGGAVIHLESSPPGVMPWSHNYIVSEIAVRDGRETLGRTIETVFTLDAALNAANRHINR